MSKETKYGIISDLQEDPRKIDPALALLKAEGIDRLIVNGDISKQHKDLEDNHAYLMRIIEPIAESGLVAFIQPGSHENFISYQPVINHFSQNFDNIIDTTENQKIEQVDHHLVFLPGSDYGPAYGEYKITSKVPTGRYSDLKDGLAKFDTIEEYTELVKEHETIIPVKYYFNMNDLTKLVTDPNKTILVCHIPRKFNNLETCVDMAHFVEIREYKIEDIEKYETMAVMPYESFDRNFVKKEKTIYFSAEEFKQIDNDELKDYMTGMRLKTLKLAIERKENRGNEDLKALYQQLQIKKAVSGHFHESGHRANDEQGNHVQENQYTNELFWNSGNLDKGELGILTVKGDLVKYRNLRID